MNMDINVKKPHPMVYDAKAYLLELKHKLPVYAEVLSLCSSNGNELARVCSETMESFLTGKPVADRYLLGLAWYIRNSEEGRIDMLV